MTALTLKKRKRKVSLKRLKPKPLTLRQQQALREWTVELTGELTDIFTGTKRK